MKKKGQHNNTMDFDIGSAFQSYKNTVFMVDTDLHLWESILDGAIENYTSQPDQNLYAAIFTVYNLDETGCNGYLEDFKGEIAISSNDLVEKKRRFLSWVRNLTTLKLYNALEIFLFQAIWQRYYPHLNNPMFNKRSADVLVKEIKTYLQENKLSTDTKNNRYLIEFMKSRSPKFATFFQNRMRTDLNTSWSNFFEMFSILRNVIAHQGTLIGKDLQNEILSKSKDVFQRHFKLLADDQGDLHLEPIGELYGNFVVLANDLALNSIKFMFEENNFDFIKKDH